MEPGTTWVERGADGRPYFVRKKLKLPSTRSLLAAALVPQRRSRSLFRYPRRDFLTMSAPVSKPPSLTAPTTEPSTSPSTTPIILPSDPGSMAYPLPYPAPYPWPPQVIQENRVPSAPQHPLKQMPQYLSGPPGMFTVRRPPHPQQIQHPLPIGAQALS